MSEKFYKALILIISVLVPLIVATLFYVSLPNLFPGLDITFFPKFHAFLNSLTTLFLLTGFYFIKNKKIRAHKFCMLTSLSLSALFLVSYVFYHAMSEPVHYGGAGFLKYLYYFILITHILLAAGILPLILFTAFRALNNQFDKHKKIARWTLPLWLYITTTGVLVYVFMAPYY